MIDVYKILKEEGHNVDAIQTYHSKNVREWEDWWKGYHAKFHKYYMTANKTSKKAIRKTLGMAKTVSEDWANMLLNDKTFIIVDDDQSQTFLCGDPEEQNGGVLNNSKFWTTGNKAMEKVFATGTAAFVIELVKPAVVKAKGKLTAESVKLKTIKDTTRIIPISWNDDEVTECAFYSIKVINGIEYAYIEIMLKNEGGTYTIENRFYSATAEGKVKRTDKNPDNSVLSYIVPCKPFFIIKPAIENNKMESYVPLGISCYANAIDILQGVDMAFDNFFSDFELGKKKVFIAQDAISTSITQIMDADSGEMKDRVVPDEEQTIEQQLFYTFQDNSDEKRLIQEFNPLLRVEENKSGIEALLNLLSIKVGMGKNRYKFDSIQAKTATEVKTSNKDLMESVQKQRIAIQDTLVEMTRSILIFGKELCGAKVNPDTKISIRFDDTIFTDEEVERLRFIQEITVGIRKRWEYRVKYLGETEEEAKAFTSEDVVQNSGAFN